MNKLFGGIYSSLQMTYYYYFFVLVYLNMTRGSLKCPWDDDDGDDDTTIED